MSVGRVCVREVDTARPDESVIVVAQRMHQRAVGTLVVTNNSSQVVGIVTDRDLVSRVLAKGMDPAEMTVRDVMTMAPKTVSEDTPIESCAFDHAHGAFSSSTRRWPSKRAAGTTYPR